MLWGHSSDGSANFPPVPPNHVIFRLFTCFCLIRINVFQTGSVLQSQFCQFLLWSYEQKCIIRDYVQKASHCSFLGFFFKKCTLVKLILFRETTASAFVEISKGMFTTILLQCPLTCQENHLSEFAIPCLQTIPGFDDRWATET